MYQNHYSHRSLSLLLVQFLPNDLHHLYHSTRLHQCVQTLSHTRLQELVQLLKDLSTPLLVGPYLLIKNFYHLLQGLCLVALKCSLKYTLVATRLRRRYLLVPNQRLKARSRPPHLLHDPCLPEDNRKRSVTGQPRICRLLLLQ
jgi:hypothetical protein